MWSHTMNPQGQTPCVWGAQKYVKASSWRVRGRVGNKPLGWAGLRENSGETVARAT